VRVTLHPRNDGGIGAAALIGVALLSAAAPAPPKAGVESRFLYGLADHNGSLRLGSVALSWDWRAGELYTAGASVINVFDDNGMRVYSFGNDPALGNVVSVAPSGDDLYALAAQGGLTWIVRCNFRGEPVSRIELRGVPAAFRDRFVAGAIAIAGDNLYLAEKGRLKVLVVSTAGDYRASYELSELMGLDPAKAGEVMMRGFSVDRSGYVLFTVSELFSAYILSPEGSLRSFGSAGSVPGKFNVAGGIAADERGHLYVTDVLRGVVMVFAREDLSFLGEFGYRGKAPWNLVAPSEVAAANGRVYVSQSIGAVKVFGVRFE